MRRKTAETQVQVAEGRVGGRPRDVVVLLLQIARQLKGVVVSLEKLHILKVRRALLHRYEY